MSEEPQQRLIEEKAKSKAEQIASHLKTQPQDIIDIRCLMHRFHASAKDFQQAFLLLEQPIRS